MSDPAPKPLSRGELQQRAVKGALWTGIHTFVSLPLAFAVNILVARVLGVADYGRLTYLSTVITIASVLAGMGVSTALLQFGARAHATGDVAQVRRLLSGSQGFRLLVTGPIVALAVVALVRVEWWLLAVALIFGVGAPALLGNAWPALGIENRTDRAAQIQMFGNAVKQAVVVLAVLTLGTADAVWSARVVVAGLILALPLASISAQYRSAVLRPSPPWRLPRAFWVFAIPTGLAGILGTLVTNRTEIVFLDWFADAQAMGLFGLAFGLAGHVYAPAQAFIGPLVPAVSALSAVDHPALRRAFHRTTRTGSAVGGLLVATALPALACLIPVIYGTDFANASDLLVVIAIGSAVMLIGSPHKAFLMARLGGRRLLWINGASLVINLALALILIPTLGAWGAAISCAGTFIALTLQLTLGEARALGISYRSVGDSVGALLLAIGIASGLWLGVRQMEVAAVPLAIGVAAVGLILYVVGLRVTRSGLTDGDASAIDRALPQRLRPIFSAILFLLRGSRAET